MDRREAVLRELNLYPQWVRRGEPVSETVQLVAAVVEVAATAALPEALHQMPTTSRLGGSAADTQQSAMGMVTLSPGRFPHKPSPANEEGESMVGNLDWHELKQQVRDCTACKLRAGCTQTVFGAGGEKAEWLFVGEAPGADEDALGEPFVGQAGKLLDSMLLEIGRAHV